MALADAKQEYFARSGVYGVYDDQVMGEFTLYGLPIATNRTVQWSRIDPVEARDLFLYHALAAGQWDRTHGFVADNKAVLEEAEALETRLRRSDLLIDLDALADWFDQRIPDSVVSAQLEMKVFRYLNEDEVLPPSVKRR